MPAARDTVSRTASGCRGSGRGDANSRRAHPLLLFPLPHNSPSLLVSVAVQAATPPAGTRLRQNGAAGSRRETPRVTGDPGPFPPRPRQRQTAGHTAGCAPNGSGHVSVRDPARTTEGFADLHRHALPSSMCGLSSRGEGRPRARRVVSVYFNTNGVGTLSSAAAASRRRSPAAADVNAADTDEVEPPAPASPRARPVPQQTNENREAAVVRELAERRPAGGRRRRGQPLPRPGLRPPRRPAGARQTAREDSGTTTCSSSGSSTASAATSPIWSTPCRITPQRFRGAHRLRALPARAKALRAA